jgi:hypothetical protein
MINLVQAPLTGQVIGVSVGSSRTSMVKFSVEKAPDASLARTTIVCCAAFSKSRSAALAMVTTPVVASMAKRPLAESSSE